MEALPALAEVASPPFSLRRHDSEGQAVETIRPLQLERVDFIVGGQPCVL